MSKEPINEITVKQQIHNIYDEEIICIFADETGTILYESTAAKAKSKGTPYDKWIVEDIELYYPTNLGYTRGIMINAYRPEN